MLCKVQSSPDALRAAQTNRGLCAATSAHGSIGARFASTLYKNEAFFLYLHTSHLSHHSDDRLCRQHTVWLRLRSPTQHARPPHRRPLSSPPRRMARSADLRLSSPEAVAATSLSHSGPSAAMSPRTSSAASPKFTRWQQAAFTASQRSHIETLLQGHNRSHDHELLHQRHVPRAKASPLRRPWPETSTHQGRHGDAALEAAR